MTLRGVTVRSIIIGALSEPASCALRRARSIAITDRLASWAVAAQSRMCSSDEDEDEDEDWDEEESLHGQLRVHRGREKSVRPVCTLCASTHTE